MTASEEIERAATCPICESNLDVQKLAQLGLSNDELRVLNAHIKDRTIRDILKTGEIALRRIDPEATNMELQVANAISQLRNAFNQLYGEFRDDMELLVNGVLKSNGEERREVIDRIKEKGDATIRQLDTQIKRLEAINKDNQTIQSISSGVSDILRKIGGTGIGTIGETITIKDLKMVAPMDDFDETRATHGGTDIIGKVNENGTLSGTITTSVKYTEKWENNYVEQITRNMEQDGSRFGVLVSKVFPREALSDKAWVMKTRRGNSIILVKPEYAPVAYFGLRQASVVWFQTRQMQEARDRESEEMERVFKALMHWINGEEFQECIRYIDCAISDTNKTKDLMNSLRDYIENKISNVIKYQDNIKSELMNATSLVRKLRELLNGSNSSF